MNDFHDGSYWIDTHCHLNLDAFDGDRDAVIERSLEARVRRILIPGIDLETTIEAKEMAAQRAVISFAAGIHPNTNLAIDASLLTDLERMARDENCAAIGEIGLDFYWDECPKDRQEENLRIQLDLAERSDLPVILHCRDAFETLFPIMREWAGRNGRNRGVFHAFDGNADQARLVVDAGFYVGIGGAVTFKNKNDRRDMAKYVPLERILLETDAPYLTPVPFRGKRNEPAHIARIGAFLAELRGVPVAEIQRQTTANANKLFSIR